MNQNTVAIKAILFDIGGTLVQKANHDSRDLSFIAQMGELLGSQLSPQDLLQQIMHGEQAYKAWRQHSFVELPLEERWSTWYLPAYPAELVRAKAQQLQRLWSQSRGRRWIEPSTVSALKELEARGYILGTVSHTSPAYLAEAGIADLFCTSIHAASYGWRKPHPAIFLEAARACGVAACECAYVGDRPSRDVIGSREAGIGQVILLQRNGQTAESEPCPMQPDVIIHAIDDLLQVFPLPQNRSTIATDCESPVLYDAALSTMWWDKEKYAADEFFGMGRKLGFARFELNHQIPPEVLESIDLNRFHIGSLHDPCPAVILNKQLEREDRVITSLDEGRRLFAVDGVKYTIDTAYRLGARSVVIHTGRIAGDHSMDDDLRDMYRRGLKGTPDYFDQVNRLQADRIERGKPHLEVLLKSLETIVQHAEGSGLTLGFENRFHHYELPNFEEMDVMMRLFTQPWVGWQLDVGHLQVEGELGLMDMQAWLDRFGARIMGVHLHDVIGIVDHRAPGSGQVDFERIAAVLPPYAQRTLEIDKSVTFDEFRSGLEYLCEKNCIKQI